MTDASSGQQQVEVARELTDASRVRVDLVRSLPRGAHVHISGICGTGMASVLQLLKQLGFYVTGSDKAFYPPMGEVVRSTADVVYEGYRAENLQVRPALAVIGNSLSRGNPEVEHILSAGIPFASMPEVFAALLIGTRNDCAWSVVISGTHGKTTTTSATATLLDQAGRKPGYFIGGIPNDLPSSIRPPAAQVPGERVVVLEGDEYDSAFFSKFSKFQSYRPDIAVVTSLEFDHADIFNTIEEIEREFTSFVARVPAAGLVLVCDTDEHLRQVALSWQERKLLRAPLAFYGERSDSRYRLLSRSPYFADDSKSGEPAGQLLSYSLDGVPVTVRTSLTGAHNALNLLAAAAVGHKLHLTAEEISAGLEQFHGSLRRQQTVGDIGGVLVIEDFAHHPTAVKVTLDGLRERYPQRRLVAAYEPRSNTSRRAFFQEAYVPSFRAADEALIVEVADAGGYSGTAAPVVALDVPRLVRELSASGVSARSLPSVPALQEYLVSSLRAGDVVVLMSNGDFGGLPQSLPAALSHRQTEGARGA